jgi:hypothetical protein
MPTDESEFGEFGGCAEHYAVGLAMEKHGGSFVSCLGKALQHADMINRDKIRFAFQDYWEEYRLIAKSMKEFGGDR